MAYNNSFKDMPPSERKMLIWVFLSIAMFGYLAAAYEFKDIFLWKFQGEITQGAVTGTKMTRGSGWRGTGGPTKFLVFYDFKASDGNTYKGRYSTNWEEAGRLETGDPLEVQYYPKNPEINHVESQSFWSRDAGFSIMLSLGLFCTGFALIILYYHRKYS